MPSHSEDGEGNIGVEDIVRRRRQNHWSKGDGTRARTDRVKWGPSGAGSLKAGPSGIIHKPPGGSRGADVAIVSYEPAGQHNRSGSQGPLDGQFGWIPAVPLGRKPAYGLNAAGRDQGAGRV